MTIPDFIGVLSLAERGYREGKTGPSVLSETAYSAEPSEAGIQVLVKWKDLLRVSEPEFVRMLGGSYFGQAWADCTSVAIPGLFTARERVGDSVVRSRARAECQDLSPPGRALLDHLVERLRQQPRSVPGNVDVKSAESGKPKAAVPPARVRIRDSSGKVWGRVEFSTDGMATLIAEQSSTFVTAILQLGVLLAKDLKDEDRRLFCQWDELPPDDWGEDHYSSFSIAYLSWVVGLTDVERKAHSAAARAADLLAKEPQKPRLEKPLSPAVRQLFGRLEK